MPDTNTEIGGNQSSLRVKGKSRTTSSRHAGLRQDNLVILLTSVLVSVLTAVLVPYNTEGDQYYYRSFYDFASEGGYFEVVSGAFGYIGTLEPMYPTIVWLVSSVLQKDIFIVLANGILAYSTLLLFRDFAIPFRVALPVVLTNFYFLVLYTGAERLKFAVLFLTLALVFHRRAKSKMAAGLVVFSILTHAQVMIILLGEVLYSSLKVCRWRIKFRDLLALIFGLSCVLILAFVLQEHLSAKIIAYMDREKDPVGLIKLVVLFFLALLAAPQRLRMACFFAPLFLLVPLVGAERLVMIAYFMYLLTYSGAKSAVLKFIYYMLLVYFSYKSVDYVGNLIAFGDGFYTE